MSLSYYRHLWPKRPPNLLFWVPQRHQNLLQWLQPILTSASNVIQQLSTSTTSAAQTLNPKDAINGTILYDAASKIAYKSWEQQHFYLRMDNNDNDVEDGSMVTIGSSSISISISSTSTIIIITAYIFEECEGDNEKITEAIKSYKHKI